MPSIASQFDAGFPTFTGNETTQQQIQKLHSYLFQLRQALQYSLQNLSSDNFSGVAWESLTQSQKDAVAEELERVGNLVTGFRADLDRLNASVNGLTGLTGQVSSLEQRMTDAEENIQGLVEWVTEEDAEVETLKAAVFGEEGSQEGGLVAGLATVTERLAALCEMLMTDTEGGIRLGAEGRDLHLIGNVYINGVAYTQGGTQ